jgi:nucleoside-diphosphate-sugar epimerase
LKRISEEDLIHVFHYTESVWEKVRNKSIFITGATGFFGKWLLESFVYINNKLSLNATITALSRNPEAFLNLYPFYKQETSVIFIKGDVQTFEFPESQFDYIIHAATDADAILNQSNPLQMMDTITVGTRRVLELAKHQHNLNSFLFVSSGAVYGKQPADVSHAKESDSFYIDINNPLSAYAEGKRVAELYCSTYFEKLGIPVKIARCFAFVGPYLPLDKHFAIGNFILDAIKQEDIIIKGDGTPYRSYLYAADLAIWLWTILFKGQDNKPYNVGSDEDITIKELAELVSSIHTGINVIVIGKRVPGKAVERYVPSIDLTKKELPVKIYINLADAIKKTIKFNESI